MNENIDQTASAVSDPLPAGEESAVAPKNSHTKRVVKAVFYHAYRLMGEITAVVLGLSFAWLCAVNMLVSQRVVDLDFLRADASRWFTGAFGVKSAEVGKMSLAWEAADNTVIFRARNIAVKTDKGAPLNGLNYVETELALRDLVQGRLDPIRVMIDGGELSFLRDPDGNFIAGLGTPDTVGQFGPIWRGQRNDGDNDLEIGKIKSLKIDSAKIFIRDAGSDYAAQLNEAKFDVAFVPDAIVFDMSANSSREYSAGVGDAAPLSFKGRVSPDLQNIDASFQGTMLNLSYMMPKLDVFEPVMGLDAPLDVSVHALANRELGLQKLEISASAEAGTLNRGGVSNSFSSANLEAAYDPVAQDLNVSNLVLISDLISADGSATLSNLGSFVDGLFSKDTQFKVQLDKARWNGASLGISPISLTDIDISGGVLRDENKVILNTLSANFGTFQPRLAGALTRGDNGGLIAASLDGRIEGSLTHEQLLSLWPKTLIIGGRRWIDRAINNAVLSNLDISLKADEAVLSGRPLKNENLRVTFDITGGEVKYISTMTPVSDVVGSGELLGNQVNFNLHQGRVDDVVIKTGKVTIPRIYPYGGDLIIEGDAQGPLTTLVALLDQKPFEYVTPYGVSADEFSGTGDISLSVTRPLRDVIRYDQVNYEFSGYLRNVSAPFAIGKNKLTDGNVYLLANRQGLSVKGPVNIGPWQADLTWLEVFDEGKTPTRYQVNGRLSQTDLDSFGLGAREFVGGGDIVLSIDAQADGLAITRAEVSADLSETDMRIGPYWSKPKGTSAMMTGVLAFTKDRQLSLEDVVVTSPGLELEGALNIGADFKLKDLNFTRAKIAGFIDASAQIKPDPNQERFDVYLTGDFLDVSPFVDSAFRGQGGGLDVPVLLTASIARFALNESYIVQDSNLLFAHNGEGITEARLKGRTNDGPLMLNFTTDSEENLRMLSIDIPDSSDVSFAFFDIQSLQGGRLQLNADLPAVGDVGPLTGTVTIEDVKVVNAPILTTMLSLASLQGLVNALGGDGLNFDQLVMPFSYSQGRLSVRDGRAAGPGLGMTGNGEIDFSLNVLDMDGVLVPAYTANSILESIPLIGDIFVGKKGEGIFALNYTVQGPFDEAQVAVNPLSALTPGFLRGIFATQRDDLPDQLREKIESVRPVTELPENP